MRAAAAVITFSVLEPPAVEPGQTAGLDEQLPRERRDGFGAVVVAMGKVGGHGADGGRGGSSGLLAAAQRSRRAQV